MIQKRHIKASWCQTHTFVPNQLRSISKVISHTDNIDIPPETKSCWHHRSDLCMIVACSLKISGDVGLSLSNHCYDPQVASLSAPWRVADERHALIDLPLASLPIQNFLKFE